MPDAVVVGAGHNGLTAAAVLGAAASEELIPGDGVFLCGAGTSPGGEVSGLRAADAVLERLS